MSTDEHDTLLLKIAEDIADGKPIDWSSLEGRVDAPTLSRLRDLAQLAGHFDAAKLAVTESVASTFEKPAPTERTFAHLRVLSELGRGSSGIVYRAHDPLLMRVVALKLCHPEGGPADDLLREAQQMARIDHPGVLKIHGVQVVDGQVGFWSDLVEGESIATRLHVDRRIPTHEAILIGLELCSALAAIHQVGLVHGDVKAQNVVRGRAGGHVLIDFGSARRLNERTQVSGTPLYLAPELLDGGQGGPEDDLYSLGVLLFRMMSGRFPVEAESLTALAEAHRSGSRQHLLDLLPQLDARTAAIVERAVDPVRSRRYTSAGAFAAALRQCLPAPDRLDNTQRLDGPTEPPRKAANRRSRWFVLAGAAAVLMVAMGIGYRQGLLSQTGPIAAEVRLVRTTGGVETRLADGDAITVGETLALDLELAVSAHVYVMNEDATGAVYQLFPLPMGEPMNPLPAGKRIRLPGRVGGKDQDWQVTSPGVHERFYVLIAPEALTALHPASTRFSLAESGRPLDRSALYAAARVTRGVGGLNERADGSNDTGFPVGDWLKSLALDDRRLTLHRFELTNRE